MAEADESDRSLLNLSPEARDPAERRPRPPRHLRGRSSEVEEVFREFVARLPADGVLVVGPDDAGAGVRGRRALRGAPGGGRAGRLLPGRARPGPSGVRRWCCRRPPRARAAAAGGRHNADNAACALALADWCGVPLAARRGRLAASPGVGRRMEPRGSGGRRGGGGRLRPPPGRDPRHPGRRARARRRARGRGVPAPPALAHPRPRAPSWGRPSAPPTSSIVTEVYLAREPADPAVSGRDVAAAVPGAGAGGLRGDAGRGGRRGARRGAPGRPAADDGGGRHHPAGAGVGGPPGKTVGRWCTLARPRRLPEHRGRRPARPADDDPGGRDGRPRSAGRLVRAGSSRPSPGPPPRACRWPSWGAAPTCSSSDEGFRGMVMRLVGRLTSISVRGDDLWCGGGASLPARRAARRGPRPRGPRVRREHPRHRRGRGRDERRGPRRASWPRCCAGRWSAGPRGAGGWAPRTWPSATGGRPSRRARWSPRRASRCAPGTAEAIAARLAEFRAHRRATQPQGVRTFGSVFTNPEGDSAGRLLEAAGCKGLVVGGARFSPVHANFIEASPGCRSADVLRADGRGPAPGARGAAGPRLVPEVRYLDPRARHRARPPGRRVSARAPRPAQPRARRTAHPAVAERRREIARARGRRRRSGLVLVLGTAAVALAVYWLADRAAAGDLRRGGAAATTATTGRSWSRAVHERGRQGTIIAPATGTCAVAADRFPWVESVRRVARLAARAGGARDRGAPRRGRCLRGQAVLVSATGRVLGPEEGTPGVGWLRLDRGAPAGRRGDPRGLPRGARPDRRGRPRGGRAHPRAAHRSGRSAGGPPDRRARAAARAPAERLAAKARALGLVLADVSAEEEAAASYIDLTVPERPALGPPR